jgi:uncharacterized membrane protein YgdD (TMEM256/DUF423 family)
MDKKIVATAAVMGAVSIILGAFGAHALKKVLDSAELVTFETGVRYQMYNSLFLLFVGIAPLAERMRRNILWLVLSGVLLFSGSIYLLATNRLTSVDFSIIGFITPIGGLLIIVGWLILFVGIFRNKS